MTRLVRLAHEYPAELYGTLRARYGVSWAQVGQPSLPWHEAALLIEDALADPSTSLGAAVAGWFYPARVTDLALILALGGEAAQDAMPFAMDPSAKQSAPSDDDDNLDAAIAAAEADMAALIRFS